MIIVVESFTWANHTPSYHPGDPALTELGLAWEFPPNHRPVVSANAPPPTRSRSISSLLSILRTYQSNYFRPYLGSPSTPLTADDFITKQRTPFSGGQTFYPRGCLCRPEHGRGLITQHEHYSVFPGCRSPPGDEWMDGWGDTERYITSPHGINFRLAADYFLSCIWGCNLTNGCHRIRPARPPRLNGVSLFSQQTKESPSNTRETRLGIAVGKWTVDCGWWMVEQGYLP